MPLSHFAAIAAPQQDHGTDMMNLIDTLMADGTNAELLAVAAIATLIVLARRAMRRTRHRSSS
jgi:hypothetical protein